MWYTRTGVIVSTEVDFLEVTRSQSMPAQSRDIRVSTRGKILDRKITLATSLPTARSARKIPIHGEDLNPTPLTAYTWAHAVLQRCSDANPWCGARHEIKSVGHFPMLRLQLELLRYATQRTTTPGIQARVSARTTRSLWYLRVCTVCDAMFLFVSCTCEADKGQTLARWTRFGPMAKTGFTDHIKTLKCVQKPYT